MMTEPWFWPLISALIIGAAGGWWAIVNRRGGEKFRARNPLPPSWPEQWARIDALEARIDAQDAQIEVLQKRDQATRNVLRALADQWPHEDLPVLNQNDVEVLADTLPVEWARQYIRPRKRPRNA